MSGGHFDYNQQRILYIKEAIEHEIEMQGHETEYGEVYETFEPEVLQRLKEGIEALKKAYVYTQRIDWYFSGDDGKESFLKRLKEDLKQL
jgi:hypothetical protein